MQQPADLPKLQVAIDRTKASGMGLTERDVANSVLLSLSGSGQVQPVYWIDPRVGIQYLVNVRVPEPAMDSLAALNSIPINASQPGEGDVQLLANLATVTRTTGPPIVSHYNVMPVIDVFGGVSGRDLGGVLRDLKPLIAQAERACRAAASIILRGQAETMQSQLHRAWASGWSWRRSSIYLLLVVNFQSWLDPFIIITALPGALAGVVWALHLTLHAAQRAGLDGRHHEPGRRHRQLRAGGHLRAQQPPPGHGPAGGGLGSRTGRLRPVLMTALAMVIGMLPDGPRPRAKAASRTRRWAAP